MTNGRDHAPAVYGKIRVLAGGERLPRLLPERAAANRRLLAAYLDRPLIPQNFSADECLDPWSGRSLDDWWTFYEGGTRLVEYLQPRRLQRADAGRAGRRQHDLSQRAGWSRRRATTRARSSPRAKTRSARTCWKCCCGCSTARICN